MRRVLPLLVTALLFVVTAEARHRSTPSVQLVEIEGTIKSVSPTEIVVTDNNNHDVTVAITPDTIFRSGDMAIAPADLKKDQRVEIKAVRNNDALNAVLVRVEDNEPQEPEAVEINGTIKSVSATKIVVTDARGTDIPIVIDSHTMIFKGNNSATTGDLAIGDRVEVRATKSGTTLTAVLIRAENAEPELLEVHGKIKSVSATELVVTDRQANDVTFKIDSHTLIRKGGHAAAVTDLAVGDMVEVKATVSGTTKTAVMIDAEAAEPPQNQEVEVEGSVTAVGTNQLTVHTAGGDVTVKTDTNTRIRKNDQTIALGDIHTGDVVQAEGTRVDDHTMLARQIEVHTSGSGGHH
jgi:hypothetical protein